MKCDLNILDSLILNDLNPANLKEAYSEKEYSEWLSIAQEFKIQYENNFLIDLFSLKEERLIKQHVYCHQERLTFLSDQLFVFINHNENTNNTPLSLTAIQKSVCKIIEDLILFLRERFPKYFRCLQPAPKKLIHSVRKEFSESLHTLKSQLTGDNKLWEIALEPYEIFTRGEKKSLSFKEIDYLKDLLNELKNVPGSILFQNDEGIIKKILFSNNFNSWKFLFYLTEEIKNSVEAEDTLTGQLEKYYWHQKVVNQSLTKPSLFLHYKRASIKDSLSAWISEEIIFVEKRFQLLQPVNGSQNRLINGNFKIETELSVPQLAFFIRILTETGTIRNKNLKELLGFFSRHFQTKRVLNISLASLYSKYYNVTDSDKSVVKSFLIRMLNRLNN